VALPSRSRALVAERQCAPACVRSRVLSMMDVQANIEKYEIGATECEMIARLATDEAKRALHERLATHYREFAAALAKMGAKRDAA
jgi:hypothetical protein